MTQIQETRPDPLAHLFGHTSILLPTTHRVMVWDVQLLGLRPEDLSEKPEWGRVRIVALVPLKPHPLENIHFAAAFCSPKDIKRYRKDIANRIACGRLSKYLTLTDEERTNLDTESSIGRNCGTIPKIEDLKGFVEKALLHIGRAPDWIEPEQFHNDDLAEKLLDMHGWLVPVEEE